jgi:hypothetical protein
MSDEIRFTAKMQGTSEVIRLLKRHPEKIGRTLESLVKQEARGLAVELARCTRPHGFSEKARKHGERAVAKDIGSVFALPSDAFEEIRKSDPTAADRFWANIQNRRFSRAQTALRSSGSAWSDLTVGRLDPNLHGWGKFGGRMPKQIVNSPKTRETYIQRIQKRVGFAKGTWINAAKSIGGRVRGAAQWASRHRKAPGSATIKTGTRPSVTLISRLDYMDDVLSYTGIRIALNVASGKLRKALVTSVRKINERVDRSLRRRAG